MERARTRGPRRFRLPRDAHARDVHDAAVRIVEACDAREQRGLARAGGPDDGDELAGRGGQGDPAQREGLLVACVVEAVELVRVEDEHQRQRNDSVTVRQGSTLSEPWGACSVIAARRPPFQNS